MVNQQVHVLLCLSSSPSNIDVIRMAASMAHECQAIFTALYVETPDSSNLSKEDREQLQFNTNLARQLGANVETAYGLDVAYQINEFCKNAKVTKVFLGYSQKRYPNFFSPNLDKQLLKMLQDIDLNIVYHKKTNQQYKKRYHFVFKGRDFFISVLSLLVATVIGVLFHHLGFSEANTITVYILSVLITAISTSERIYSLVSSILSVLVFNFMFTNPRFTLAAYGSGYPMTFAIMLIAAFITSTLAIRIKQQAKQSAQHAYRTKILLETNRLLQKEKSTAGIKETTAKQIIKLLNKPALIYQINNDQVILDINLDENIKQLDNLENNVRWVYQNNKTFHDQNYYLPIASANDIYGVLIIVLDETFLDAFEDNLILSIIGECALALEKELFNQKKEEAAIEAKNERLRANLLRSISHDLRTPLTSISGNANVLMNSGDNLDNDKKHELYEVIYDDSLWLINLVENLLSVTRIEDNKMNLHLETELIDEVINEALSHISRKKEQHQIKLIAKDEFILAKIDASLIIQVIINIIDNAIKYTPSGSLITIETIKHNHFVEIRISDNGQGISDQDKEKLFEMFYTAKHDVIDGRRGLGLGLALCKSIVIAHGGQIKVEDNLPQGTVFSFTLPIEEVKIHE